MTANAGLSELARRHTPISFPIGLSSTIYATPEMLIVRRLPTWRRR